MKKLLVIDDQRQVLEIVSHFLGDEGYNVATATSGKEGLDLAIQWRPDVILCDIMMPGMTGFDVLAAARQHLELATTPFIFLTAKASPQDLRMGMTRGADDYLTKPFTGEELVAAVEAQIEKHAAFQERYQQKLNLLRQGLSMVLPHELRTPLTLILAHTSLLLEAGSELERDALMDMIQVIHDSGLRLHRLLENLLLYVTTEGDARLRLEHPITPSAREALLAAASARADQRGRKDDLRASVPEGSLQIHPLHLRKIADELLDNAFKFSKPGEPVRLEVRNEHGAFDMIVEDRGHGMSAEQIDSVDAYVQFNRSIFEQQGAGMGLVVVRRLVELYSGTMEIQSQLDRGTLVRIHIPNVWSSLATATHAA